MNLGSVNLISQKMEPTKEVQTTDNSKEFPKIPDILGAAFASIQNGINKLTGGSQDQPVNTQSSSSISSTNPLARGRPQVIPDEASIKRSIESVKKFKNLNSDVSTDVYEDALLGSLGDIRSIDGLRGSSDKINPNWVNDKSTKKFLLDMYPCAISLARECEALDKYIGDDITESVVKANAVIKATIVTAIYDHCQRMYISDEIRNVIFRKISNLYYKTLQEYRESNPEAISHVGFNNICQKYVEDISLECEMSKFGFDMSPHVLGFKKSPCVIETDGKSTSIDHLPDVDKITVMINEMASCDYGNLSRPDIINMIHKIVYDAALRTKKYPHLFSGLVMKEVDRVIDKTIIKHIIDLSPISICLKYIDDLGQKYTKACDVLLEFTSITEINMATSGRSIYEPEEVEDMFISFKNTDSLASKFDKMEFNDDKHSQDMKSILKELSAY